MLKQLPDTEKFALKSQMRRAVLSILANIAESEGTFPKKSKINFLYIARGSLFELKSYLLAIRSVYPDVNMSDNVMSKIDILHYIINKTIKRISTTFR